MSMPKIDPGEGICAEQALADVIETIALQEAGLSHIINAEGEILQYFVDPNSSAARRFTTEEMATANSSIEALLNAISAFEQSLNAKLQTAVSGLQDKPKPPRPC